MAMEKLILRSVLYGVDKIPDPWFEKLPGGFFGDNASNKRNTDSPSNNRSINTNGGRRSYDNQNDDYDDGYRSDGHRRRHQRSQSSFDGGADDDDYYPGGDDRHRRRSGKSHRRRHSTEDDQRGQHDGRHGSRRGDMRDDHDPERNRYRRRDLRSPDLNYDRARPMSGGGSDGSANRFSFGSSAAAAHPPYPRSSAAESPAMQSPTFSNAPPPRSGSINNGYIPYSNVYGQDTQQAARQQPFSPPPPASARSPQQYSDNPNSSPVAPLPRGYQQNPFAQQAPTAADAGAGAAYIGGSGFVNQEQDPRWANGPDPKYNPRLYINFDENNAPNPNTASPRRSSRRDYSPTYDSYDTRTQDRRSRSERRPADDKPKAQGKSKSRLRETFTTSQRGLGYSTIGAVTGGLIINEYAKGAIPMVLGAAVGGLGTNAFQAREKYTHPRPPRQAQRPTQPPPPAMDRRKEGRRNSEYPRDGTGDRSEPRRRGDEGYYSD